MEKGIMFLALAASAAAATMKIRNLTTEQLREIKAKREFNENKAAVLAAAKEELANREQTKEEKPIKLYPYQKDMMAKMIKSMREREEEEKKLRKWYHYAKHAKKWRTRKKYKKRIREHYENRKPRGGNWPYGSGAGMFYLKADRSHFYPRIQGHQGAGIGEGLSIYMSERMIGGARGGRP